MDVTPTKRDGTNCRAMSEEERRLIRRIREDDDYSNRISSYPVEDLSHEVLTELRRLLRSHRQRRGMTLPPQPVPKHCYARSGYSAMMAASNVQVKFCLRLHPPPKSQFATYGEHYPEQTQKPQNFLLHYSRHCQRCVGSF